ncbi:MAG: hypothetical protein CL933_18735 [Deltaproteobacteria bacterium]|nr:hypothetical protein [Deltaproteobacteria bacterium]
MARKIQVAMVSSLSGDAAKADQAFRPGASRAFGKPFDPEITGSLIEDARGSLPRIGAEGERI